MGSFWWEVQEKEKSDIRVLFHSLLLCDATKSLSLNWKSLFWSKQALGFSVSSSEMSFFSSLSMLLVLLGLHYCTQNVVHQIMAIRVLKIIAKTKVSNRVGGQHWETIQNSWFLASELAVQNPHSHLATVSRSYMDLCPLDTWKTHFSTCCLPHQSYGSLLLYG